jgi:hypothetical protein
MRILMGLSGLPNFLSLFLLTALTVCATDVAARERAIVTLEEPRDWGESSGIGNIRGWVVSDDPVGRVEIWINDTYFSDVPYGSLRTDVKRAYPSYPNSENSGFGQAFNFGDLGRGYHTVTVVAYSSSGAYLGESTAEFAAKAFPEPFYEAHRAPRLVVAESRITSWSERNDSISVGPVILGGGENVDLDLTWVTATQSFEVKYVFADAGCGTWEPRFSEDFSMDDISFRTVLDRDRPQDTKIFIENSSRETVYLGAYVLRTPTKTLIRAESDDLTRDGEILGYMKYESNMRNASYFSREGSGTEAIVADFYFYWRGECFQRSEVINR